MEFRFDPHFPPALFHLDAQLIDQFANAMSAFLFLGILNSFAPGIGVTRIDDGYRVRRGGFSDVK